MTGSEYQTFAMKTNNHDQLQMLHRKIDGAVENPSDEANVAQVLNACLGLSGETGEFTDMIKKWLFHDTTIDILHAKKELGDIMWYIAQVCDAFEWDLDEILMMNIDKLRSRYPEGFDISKSNNRKSGDV